MTTAIHPDAREKYLKQLAALVVVVAVILFETMTSSEPVAASMWHTGLAMLLIPLGTFSMLRGARVMVALNADRSIQHDYSPAAVFVRSLPVFGLLLGALGFVFAVLVLMA
jgi:hypothetical protein